MDGGEVGGVVSGLFIWRFEGFGRGGWGFGRGGWGYTVSCWARFLGCRNVELGMWVAFCFMVLLLRGMAWGRVGVLCGERGLHIVGR